MVVWPIPMSWPVLLVLLVAINSLLFGGLVLNDVIRLLELILKYCIVVSSDVSFTTIRGPIYLGYLSLYLEKMITTIALQKMMFVEIF